MAVMVMDAEAQKRQVFQTFDLDGSGEITQFDLQFAFQACDDIGTLVTEKDVTMAMRRCGVPPGQTVSFAEFSAMADFVANFLRPKKRIQEFAREIRVIEAQEEVAECQASPRRLMLKDDMPQPSKPASPRALIDEPGKTPTQRAFETFDSDGSGAVSSIELRSMLKMVPKRGGGNLGPPPASAKPKVHQKYDDKLRRCLQEIGKQPADLLNLDDLETIVFMLDPPPPPAPEPSPDDEGYETTESERERRREAEERRRREEEARQEADRINAGTLVVQYDGGYLVLHFCESGDSVGSILRKIIEKLPHLEEPQMRLVGRGFEMDPRSTLDRYGVKVGHPQTHGGDVLQLMVRGAAPEKSDVPEIVSGMLNVQRQDGSVVQVYAEDDEPLEYLMQRIEEQEGTPYPWQRLVVHGREMNPKKALRDYEVTLGPQGDTVDLLVRETGAIPDRMQWH